MNYYDKSKEYIQYIEDVLSGNQITGNLIQLSCQRCKNWFSRDDIEFRYDKAELPINFMQKLKHFQGKSAGKYFVLEKWQKWVTAMIFGWYWKDTNTRVINKAVLTISRKNGKSFFASAISLYMLIADGEQAAQILNVANNTQQAHLLFEMTQNCLKSIDPKHKYTQIFRDSIRFDRTHSYARICSSDSSGLDGSSPFLALLDETHEMKDSKLFDVFQSGQGFRESPLIMQISTSGFHLDGFLYKYREMCVNILKGLATDDTLFMAFYELDEGDNWDDENVWVKSNPNLGVTIPIKFIREQVNNAKNNPSLEVSVKTKTLNMWVQSSDVWLSDNLITDCMRKFELKDFTGDVFAYGGVDLAATSDLTAYSLCIPYEDKYYFKTWYFLPETQLKESPLKEMYKEWRNKGYLIVTPGNVTDYNYITTLIGKTNNEIPITKIAYDRWNSIQWAIDATEKGFPIEPFSQSIGNFSIPTKAIERQIKMGDVIIDENPITRFCFQCATLRTDSNDNVKPTKTSYQTQKIDGVISMIQSFGIMLFEPQYSGEILNLYSN